MFDKTPQVYLQRNQSYNIMRLTLIVLCLFVFTSSFSQSKKELEAQVTKLKAEIEQLKKPKEVDLSTEKKKAGYAMGVLFANNIKSQGGDSLDIEAMQAAIKDVFQKNTLKIDQQACMPIAQKFMTTAAELKSAAQKGEGIKFLEQNKLKQGVKVTASGLQYQVIEQGYGKIPTVNDKVTVHYTGMLIDGFIFDSSVQRGKPETFGVTQVIKGWTEALQLMHEGDKWRLYIPYELAYGERGAGGSIPPYATLIFEVELIKVN